MMMNFLDLSTATEEERRLIREILSDTSVVNIVEPLLANSNSIDNQTTTTTIKNVIASETCSSISLVSDTSATTNTTQQPPSISNVNANTQHQHINGQRHAYKSSQSGNHLNCSPHSSSNNANNTSTTPTTTTTNSNSSSAIASATPLAHRTNYNSQRKNIHNNSNNNSNSIGNSTSNNIRNSRVPSLNNVANVLSNPQQQQHYPQKQYTPPPPSNASSSSPHFHNVNVNNISNHSANANNSQINHHQQRTNEQTNDRLRSNLSNQMNSNNEVNNIAVTSSSNIASLNTHTDPHLVNTMPLNIYTHHNAHLHHQVPSILPNTAKIDPKNANLKNQPYHSQGTSNSINNSTGNQSVPTTAQMPPLAGDMNSVIGMDMTSTQPPSYAIPPPHVTAFAPPPHHVYSGGPIFQPYYHLIPYNLPPYVPYVIPPNSVVPPRQQVPLQSNHSPHSSSPNSHPRHITQQQKKPEQYNNSTINSPISQRSLKDGKDHNKNMESSGQILETTDNEKEKSEMFPPEVETITNHNLITDKSSPQVEDESKDPQESEFCHEQERQDTKINNSDELPSNQEKTMNKIVTLTPKPNIVTKNCSSTVNKNKNIVPSTRGDKPEGQTQIIEVDTTTAMNSTNKSLLQNKTANLDSNKTTMKQDERAHPTTFKLSLQGDMVKVSSNEVPESPTGADTSKQSEETSMNNCDQTKSSQVCNKSTAERNGTVELTETLENKFSNDTPQPMSGSASSKSWADLFKRRSSEMIGASTNGDAELNNVGLDSEDEHRVAKSSSQMAVNSKLNQPLTSAEQRSQEAARRALDSMAPRVAQKISSINLKHALPFLKPRGFINKGNGCYINATLQALIACPPFYNLMKDIGDLRCFRRENSSTPILDSFAEFFLNFPPLDSGKKNKQLTSPEQRMHLSNLHAEAIEPRCIYNVLGQIKSECLKGAQEDAEEFLSSVLNGLHEEMIGLMEVNQDTTNHNEHSDADDTIEDVSNDENLWREVGSKNRSLPIRTAKVINTPIQEIFGGSLFSIRTAGKDRCGHRSPFFDLQLDISGDNIKSVQDAIKSFTATEVIHDFYCSKTKQKLDAQQRTSLDQLPPILILHLKQFVYTQDHGLKKLIKKIDYPIDFELPENCLHEKNSSDKNLLTSRSYKLLAVVYHDGKEAIKGHYLTDVYHIGSSSWIRCDDSNLRVIPAPRIENPETSHRTPYLLFYRRLNTLRAQTSNYDNKKKN